MRRKQQITNYKIQRQIDVNYKERNQKKFDSKKHNRLRRKEESFNLKNL